MSSYAKGTRVSVEGSLLEIKKNLRRFGCEGFGMMEQGREVSIAFTRVGISCRISILLPDDQEARFWFTHNGTRRRSADVAEKEWEQEVKRKWRELSLYIKATLVAVEAEIVTFEQAFLPFVVIGHGETISDRLLPDIEKIVQTGKIPQLFGLPPKGGATV